MLEIKNLNASINNKEILKGLNISIKPGELHAIMGPNGSGKSTLANVLSGKEGYKISGELRYLGKSLNEIPIDEDPIPRMNNFFSREIDLANSCGLMKGFIDPGLGFYYSNLKDSEMRIRHQMKTFLNSFRLRKLGWPVCNALPHAFECFGEEVRSAEPFFAVLASLGKTDLIRTHEVSKVEAVLKTLKVY